MRRYWGIPNYCLTLLLLSLIFHAVCAQTADVLEATVSMEDVLRDKASSDGRVLARLTVGAKLFAVRAATPGWYLVKRINGQTPVGYLRAKSLKLSKSTDKERGASKLNALSGAVIVDLPAEKNSLYGQRTNASINHCKAALFCPDINDVFVTLNDNIEKLVKGKFEKTLDWERRRTTAAKEIQFGPSRNLSEKLYFFYDYLPRSPVPTEWEYDADREIWNISFEIRSEGDRACIPVMSPGYGTEFCLVVGQERPVSGNMTIAMSPSKAKLIDKKMQLAFGGHLVEPFVRADGIFFKLEDIVGINPMTGEYWKAHVEPVRPTVVPTPIPLVTSESELSEIDVLRRQLIRDPGNAVAFVTLGKKFLASQEHDNAMRSLMIALDWDSRSIEAHLALAEVYFTKSDTTQALKHLDAVLADDPQNKHALKLKELILAPKIAEKADNVEALIARPLEGDWRMSLQSSKQQYDVSMSIFRAKSKFKGYIVFANNSRTRVFDVSYKPAGSLKFEVSLDAGVLRNGKMKFSGHYNGVGITGTMVIQQGPFREEVIFKSVVR